MSDHSRLLTPGDVVTDPATKLLHSMVDMLMQLERNTALHLAVNLVSSIIANTADSQADADRVLRMAKRLLDEHMPGVKRAIVLRQHGAPAGHA